MSGIDMVQVKARRVIAVMLAIMLVITALVPIGQSYFAFADEVNDEETTNDIIKPEPTDPITPLEPEDEPRPTPGSAKVGTSRVYGNTGYETSLAIANALKKELGVSKFKTIVLASGKTFPDALSASALAARKLAPVILVPGSGTNQVIEYVRANLTSNGTIYILGGHLAVSESVASALKPFGNVIRLEGANRYETNLKALNAINLERGTNLIVCSGKSFQDALSASTTGLPILLVDERLGDKQREFLAEHVSPESKIYIAGGTFAVSETVEGQLRNYTSNISRVYGKDSYSTATAIAKTFYPNAKQALVATTKSFRDGLSGSVLAYVKAAPLLLTARNEKFEETYKYITTKKINSITILGGDKAVDGDSVATRSDGTLKRGFLSVGGKKYFADESYNIQKSTIISSGGSRYYMNKKGVMVTNQTIKVDGETWIAAKDGTLSKADKVIYLTFDDGPGPYTERLINILNKYGAKATFFVNANRSTYNYCIGKAYDSGHAIGNHTKSHDYSYCYSSTSNFWDDVAACNKVIKNQTGKETRLLRFPGGSSNTVSRAYSSGIMSTLARQCDDKGWTYFDWNVDSNDAGGTTSASGVYNNIVSGVSGKKNAVVLCHDIKSYTVDAIEDVIIWGQNNGYVFLPLNSGSPTAHHGINN